MTPDVQTPSTRPYLIRALHEWCVDNGFTPYVTVWVDNTVQVPREFVKDGEIVLNIGLEATTGLKLGNEYIEFKARFGGVVRDIFVPMDQVAAIFARESGQGMAFPRVQRQQADESKPIRQTSGDLAAKHLSAITGSADSETGEAISNVTLQTSPVKRPSLTRIK
ncbi:MAG: ClpXP protease specificity-enhancing factor [Betaproteobacteria bacterium]|nr:ClpXP protease specificity-enhancing factor [Betaproteobacteria bacterium]NCP81022.1 ClpXP protease specificity-enhancing factor [Rhodoferax sp.]OIP16760.1 MAG: ClpXP protease specificity-enhancing factor [Comamonadaceae bacterium CG2_30_57_122]PIZ21391.1 MAG: ClpXP protease specificity-enhancing factor [Comamonadaceae bacterium CG_4_10_14_0_8_um_filter_57_29]PJC13180.1 MAG: ClpXP protease specificity-enhancing factor [Comamonadaceae bacterium CG_4_9_14_0_8_um_filter_57_21]